MNRLFFLALTMLYGIQALCQTNQHPLEKNNFLKATNYDELSGFVAELDKQCNWLKAEAIGKSVEGRNIYALQFSYSEFGKDKSKIRVIFFAQQHGNEQSGKEGALYLAMELVKPENKYLFDKMDFVLIPQINPDGSELNKRRNANGADLNRNHLLLTEPEVVALHRYFNRYQFEVNLDVHEYAPYGEEWKKFGYRKNSDITLGVVTNNNIAPKIMEMSNNQIAPFILNYVKEKGFSSLVYCPGGPPEIDYIRHSTFDINDGRQSFGILNSFSFIQEGLNGTDTYVENIKHRAQGQMTGMYALLQFVVKHAQEMKNMVKQERLNLVSGKTNELVSIQAEHVKNGTKLKLPLLSYSTGKDTLIEVDDYRPVVKSTHDVKKPIGYLIPKDNEALVNWMKRQELGFSEVKNLKKYQFEQYLVKAMDSIDFERDIIINPLVEPKILDKALNPSNYYFVSTNQLKANMLVLALEPKSMLGLVTYKVFGHLLKIGETYPILRVLKN